MKAPPDLWFGAHGGTTAVFLDVARDTSWRATFFPAGQWITFANDRDGTGLALIRFTAS